MVDRLIQIPRPADADEVRRCAVALCRWADGLDVGPQQIYRYLQLAGPGITEDYVRWDRYSGCGIVAEGIHRMLQVDAECLYQPYVPGTAISRAIRYMRGMDAWVDASDPDCGHPVPGSYVVIGCRGEHGTELYGGSEHALTVTSFLDEWGIVVSVDGGQAGPHGEAITRRERRWEIRRGRPLLIEQGGLGRYVLGWGDVDRLAFRDGLITVPDV